MFQDKSMLHLGSKNVALLVVLQKWFQAHVFFFILSCSVLPLVATTALLIGCFCLLHPKVFACVPYHND